MVAGDRTAGFASEPQVGGNRHLLLSIPHDAGGFSIVLKPTSKSEWEKANPLDSRTAGCTRALVKSRASASSDPSSNLGPILGTGNRAGRDSTAPRIRVNSRLVTGFGAVKFTGPRMSFSQQPRNRPDLVVEGDPAPPLGPGSEPSAQAELASRR